jgi:hypothetical protein
MSDNLANVLRFIFAKIAKVKVKIKNIFLFFVVLQKTEDKFDRTASFS